MSIMEFWSLRRAERRARKADRAMRLVFGAAWDVSREGVYDLLTAPAPLVVLDVGMLRGVVEEALAGAEGQAVNTSPVEPVYEAGEPDGETFDVEPAAEVESPRETSIFEGRANGVEAVPVDMSNDDRRRAFVRSFLDNQKAARGGVPTSLRS